MSDAAKRLIHARELAGYATPVDAARAFGWKEPTYYGHENGSRGIREATARRYAKAFRVSPAWLLTGEGDPKTGVNQPHPPKYERELLIAAIEGLLSALLADMDSSQAHELAEAVLGLVELRQRHSCTDSDRNNLRTAVAATARLAVPQ
jgi:phage repressor protein C with HTH and peptisase S24 domain